VSSSSSAGFCSACSKLDAKQMVGLFRISVNIMLSRLQDVVGHVSEENAEEWMSLCSWNCCSVAVFHSRTVESSEPDMMRVPSGENETDKTDLVCPRKGSPNGSPVAASHTRTVKSTEPDTTRMPQARTRLTKLLQCALGRAHPMAVPLLHPTPGEWNPKC